jgi:hypothetical protein
MRSSERGARLFHLALDNVAGRVMRPEDVELLPAAEIDDDNSAARPQVLARAIEIGGAVFKKVVSIYGSEYLWKRSYFPR